MLIDPTFVTQLNNSAPYTTLTLAFIKKVMNAFTYVDAVVAGSLVNGQVKKGDGTNLSAITNVKVTVVGGTVAVTIGTAKAASVDLSSCWLQTNSSGSFQVSITGLGTSLIELVTSQGIPIMVTIP